MTTATAASVTVTVDGLDYREGSVAVLTGARPDGSRCFVAADVRMVGPILDAVDAGEAPAVTVPPWQVLEP
jgi:hypothetical protein